MKQPWPIFKTKKKKALSRLRFTCYREVGGTGPLLASSCLWDPPGYSRSNQGLAQCGKLQNSLQTLLNLCLREVPWQSGHLKSVCKAKCLLTMETTDRERDTKRDVSGERKDEYPEEIAITKHVGISVAT